jgi:hypothetical protein
MLARGLKVACDRRERTHRRFASKREPIFEREDRETRDRARAIQQQGRGPISPAPVVVSVEKPIEGSSPDVRRDDTIPIGAV